MAHLFYHVNSFDDNCQAPVGFSRTKSLLNQERVARGASLSVVFHVIEVLVHDLKAYGFIKPYGRYIRHPRRDTRARHSASLHPAQSFEQYGAHQTLSPIGWHGAN